LGKSRRKKLKFHLKDELGGGKGKQGTQKGPAEPVLVVGDKSERDRKRGEQHKETGKGGGILGIKKNQDFKIGGGVSDGVNEAKPGEMRKEEEFRDLGNFRPTARPRAEAEARRTR